MIRNTKLLAVAGTIAAAVVAYMVIGARGDGKAREPDGVAAARGAGPPTRAPELPGSAARDWTPGLEYVHQLELDQTLVLQGAPGSAATVVVGITGELTQTVVDAEDAEVHVRYALDPTRLVVRTGQGELDDRSRATVLAAMREPFYVAYRRDGAVLRTFMSAKLDPTSQATLRTLVSALQVVLSPEQQADWTSRELDTTGSYDAAYRLVAQPASFEKVRRSYVGLGSTDAAPQPIPPGMRIEPRGQTRFALDDRRWIESLSADEHLAVHTQLGPSAVGDLKVTVRFRARRSDAGKIGSFSGSRAGLVGRGLAEMGVAPEPRESKLRRIVGDATLDSLIGELNKLPDDGALRGPAKARVMQRLTALFELDPAAARAARRLITSDSARDVYSPVIGSLSAASTPAAVETLAQMSGDASLERKIRVDAVAGLGVVGKPAQSGVDQLAELAQDPDAELRSTATLALGTTANHLRANDDPGAERLLDQLRNDVTAARDPNDRILKLGALANTGDAGSLPAIEQALTSDAAPVRAAAVEALRLIRDARADALLATALMKDPSPEVRRRAIFASSFRPLEPLLPALSYALSRDAVEVVRMDAVRLIGENRNSLSGAAALLGGASRSDPSEQVRRVAAQFLQAMRPA
ncbi:MAG TPA: HEAT repeat domain-containing protein [Kofleriaceae bacterium]|nr:HEAT repeat domain-containing protein [Kofleriaceae bacterium]